MVQTERNAHGTAKKRAPSDYKSWLDYWKKHTGRIPRECSVEDCHNKDLVGAHVEKVAGKDKDRYIVPICNSCNSRTETFNVTEELVPAPLELKLPGFH